MGGTQTVLCGWDRRRRVMQLVLTNGFARAWWKGHDAMRSRPINRLSGTLVIALSLTALLAVLSGYALPPQPDEGMAAHIFQLSLVALILTLNLFLATADWRQPLRSAQPLAVA